MTRILLVTDNPSDGISFYRSVMPWNEIQKEYDDVSVTVKHPKEYFNWDLFTAGSGAIMGSKSKHSDLMRINTQKVDVSSYFEKRRYN